MEKTPAHANALDPETLFGPLLHLFTSVARQDDAALAGTLQSQLLALARHPAVALDLRLAAGALALDPGQLLSAR